MNAFRFFITTIICYLSIAVYAQEKNSTIFSNDISLPSKQYMLSGVQNDMFIQTFIKRWRPYNDFVRFGGSATYLRRYEKVASIKTPKTGQQIIVDLVNGDEFMVTKSITSTICAGEPGTGNKEVVVQFIGDSYTKGEYFKSAILEKGFVPQVKCVGLRRIKDHKGQFHEGRGGWTLGNYFSNKMDKATFFNPFLQPQGAYRYWGSTAFWENALGLENGTISKISFEPNYSCGGYDCSKFTAEGRLANPEKNDVMYDSNAKSYQKWDGKLWSEINTDDLSWSFQYGKYLSMWKIQAPKFVVIMLGLNDFRNSKIPTDFTTWNEQIETVLKSYKKAVPNGKLVVCTPSTSCGTLNNEAGDFTLRQNAAMWEHRKNIIDVFDKRESDGIYVVDASITIDNENGYKQSDTNIPFEASPGEQRLAVQKGNPHPYLSYPSLGIPIAAFIQFHREKE